jgi:hypothetical protein
VTTGRLLPPLSTGSEISVETAFIAVVVKGGGGVFVVLAGGGSVAAGVVVATCSWIGSDSPIKPESGKLEVVLLVAAISRVVTEVVIVAVVVTRLQHTSLSSPRQPPSKSSDEWLHGMNPALDFRLIPSGHVKVSQVADVSGALDV